jgi:IS5 family transposase
MLAKQKSTFQLGFYSSFEEQLSHGHPLYILANTINWEVFAAAFKKHYSASQGAPAKPIRLMVSLLILEQLRDLSYGSVVEQWAENACYQCFGGEQLFSVKPPCVATELVEFRKRIGEEGIELVLKESIRINGKDADDGNLSGDTAVQEKSITYPTDDKLYKKIIVKRQKIAAAENIELRQSYKFTVNKLSTIQRFKKNKGGFAKARKASKKIKTIAGRLVREIERKISSDDTSRHAMGLSLFKKVLSQKRGGTNKTYSLHEPEVKCYTKGKEHKKFEFGSKASFLITQNTGVVVGALNFSDTLHDSKTLPAAIGQYERLMNKTPKNIFLDRGYRARR